MRGEEPRTLRRQALGLLEQDGGRDAGRSNEAALEFAAATSGQAVLISGVTVLIAMAGVLIAGNAVFTSIAVGTMLAVAVAVVLGSVTVLPAVLSKLGDRVEKGRVPIIGKRRHANHGESRVWGWILDKVLARPVVSVVASGAILIALAVPALGTKTINPGVAGIPRDLPIMQTYDRIQAAFPGGPLPALVVVQADDVTSPAVQQGIERMTDAALASGPDVRARHDPDQPGQGGRGRLDPDAGRRHRPEVRDGAGHPARRRDPDHDRQGRTALRPT